MAQFNAFEEAIDFSFWKELCEKHGKPQLFRRGEYFVRTGEVLKNVGWIVDKPCGRLLVVIGNNICDSGSKIDFYSVKCIQQQSAKLGIEQIEAIRLKSTFSDIYAY